MTATISQLDKLIEQATILGFTDDVEHWTTQRNELLGDPAAAAERDDAIRDKVRAQRGPGTDDMVEGYLTMQGLAPDQAREVSAKLTGIVQQLLPPGLSWL